MQSTVKPDDGDVRQLQGDGHDAASDCDVIIIMIISRSAGKDGGGIAPGRRWLSLLAGEKVASNVREFNGRTFAAEGLSGEAPAS